MTGKRESKISRREFVKGAGAGALFLSSVPASLAAQNENGLPATIGRSNLPQNMRRPNVIFILADDLGWGDLSCYGRPDYRTPNLDRLALQGTRFTNAYSASCVCTPTRCAFHTGRYPARLRIGLEEPLRGDNDRVGLDPGHPTIASLLQKNGYATALVGKWHLGFRPEWGPNAHGFDEFFGILAGASDYFLHRTGKGKPDLHENLTPVERKGYLTDLLTERAIEFISRRRARARGPTRPFYLSLHYTAPHWPWQGPKGGELVKFSETAGEPAVMNVGGSLKLYGEMMRSLDLGIGKVMAAVAKAGLDRNTLVIFTSDNGGERFSYQWPFSGDKGDLLEGGIRVPAIVRWPGKVSANVVTDQVAITMDWTATILSATETKADPNYPLDGEDLLPALRRMTASPHARAAAPSPSNVIPDRMLFWRTREGDAVRSGKWKYLRTGTTKFLFDLSIDEREKADFKNRFPDVLNRLSGEFESWERQMLPRLN